MDGRATMINEQQLVASARDGDTGAFGELVKEYKDPIQRYLYKLTGDVEQAGDLTQDTFLKAY